MVAAINTGNIYSVRILSHRTMTERQLQDLNELLRQLNPELTAATQEDLDVMTRDDRNAVFVAEDVTGKIVGTATLIQYNRLSGGRTGYVETVIVHNKHQRRGIGDSLMKHVENVARQSGVKVLSLTSNRTRESAHSLYHRNKFSVIDTTVFRKNIL